MVLDEYLSGTLSGFEGTPRGTDQLSLIAGMGAGKQPIYPTPSEGLPEKSPSVPEVSDGEIEARSSSVDTTGKPSTTLALPKGDNYVGDRDKGGNLHGQGTYTYVSGSKYVGQWRDNTMNGYGVYTWADGETKEGIWKNGRLNK